MVQLMTKIKGTFKISKDAIKCSHMFIFQIMHEEIDMLNRIADVRMSETEIL